MPSVSNFTGDAWPVEINPTSAVAPSGITLLSPSPTSRVAIYQIVIWAATGTGTFQITDGAGTVIITQAIAAAGAPTIITFPYGLVVTGLNVQGTVNPANLRYSIRAKSFDS